MKMKRTVSLFCAFLLAAGLMAGCQPVKKDASGESTTAAVTSAATEAQETSAAGTAGQKEPVTLRFSWWGGDTRHEATIKAIELYMEKNPHVTIEYEYMGFDSYYQKLLTQLSGGTQPEIVSVDYKWIGDLIAQGKPFLNMNELPDQIDLSSFDTDFINEYCGQDGYLIGVPCGINGRGALYNTEFFEKYGLTTADDWNWDDLLAAGSKVNEHSRKN